MDASEEIDISDGTLDFKFDPKGNYRNFIKGCDLSNVIIVKMSLLAHF